MLPPIRYLPLRKRLFQTASSITSFGNLCPITLNPQKDKSKRQQLEISAILQLGEKGMYSYQSLPWKGKAHSKHTGGQQPHIAKSLTPLMLTILS